MNINEIYFTKRRKTIIPLTNENHNSVVHVATLLKNIEAFGYTLSEELIKALLKLDETHIDEWYETIMPAIIESKGNIKVQPLYPNFPKQVMEASDCQLYIDAVIYWLTNFEVKPDPIDERYKLLDNTKLEVIELGSPNDFTSILNNLLYSKTSVSEYDKEIINWFVLQNMLYDLPEEIPNKEIAAFFTATVLRTSCNWKILDKYLKTATDYLRMLTALNNGDVGLVENTKFKSIPRAFRRSILRKLNSINEFALLEDLYRHREKWIAAAKVIHPEDYPEFKTVCSAFKSLRNQRVNHNTYNAKVEEAIKEKDYETLIRVLPQKPGEFARRLDHVLRVCYNDDLVTNSILQKFEEIAKQVPTKILAQLVTHFSNRTTSVEDEDPRAFFPKGSIAKIKVIENNLDPIAYRACLKVVNISLEALHEIYKERKPMGKVFISEDLKGIKAPLSLRNLSKSNKVLPRGSRLPINPDTKAIRFFVYWKDKDRQSITDIDLSASIFKGDFCHYCNVSYSNLRDRIIKAYHSGDARKAPEGAAEYIDIDLESAKKNGISYIAATVMVFTGDNFSDLSECFTGYMERQDVDSGEVFEPKTVKFKSDILCQRRIVMPIIIDIENNEVIWSDIPLPKSDYWHQTARGNQATILDAMRAIVNLEGPTLYSILEWNAKARGILVDFKEDADIIFDLDNADVTPYDTDIIISEYL